MSHHASGPNFGFPRGDARLDMTDLYAFPKPGDTAKSIIVLDVHPSFRLDSPEPTTKEPFAPGALYEFKIDTDGNAVAGLSRAGSLGDESRRLPFFLRLAQRSFLFRRKRQFQSHAVHGG